VVQSTFLKNIKSEKAWVYFITLFTFFIHVWSAARLGLSSDELYFIDCSKRLDFGYFDITPVVPFLLRFVRNLFGESLLGIRLIPAASHAATVFLASKVAKELGGKNYSQILAALCLLVAPAYQRLGSVFVVPTLEPLIWTFASYLLILIIKKKTGKFVDRIWWGSGFGIYDQALDTLVRSRGHFRSPSYAFTNLFF
jgi:4-amino-4-deoxy-L-arabinose transferase-like glycosyltransferase